VLDELETNGNIKVEKGDNMYMKLGIDKIPEIILDNTDRNRTSPFAFTGNKFEFRAVGSDANSAQPMAALNLIVAEVLTAFADELDKEIEAGKDKRLAMVEILRRYITESKAVRFEGDGYSDEWVQEAEKRGLSNIKNTARALNAYLAEDIVKLYEKHGVLSHTEIDARVEILLENYIMKVQIESRIMGDLALNHIIPTAISYQNKLIDNAKGLKDLGVDNSAVVATIEEISGYIADIKSGVQEMVEARKKANKLEDSSAKAAAYCDEVKEAYFEKIRYAVDKLELLVDDEDWPLVKYRELLFLR
ncbi:MAG: glutamine synthetase type III, partial [Bacteroidota bacterium]